MISQQNAKKCTMQNGKTGNMIEIDIKIEIKHATTIIIIYRLIFREPGL